MKIIVKISKKSGISKYQNIHSVILDIENFSTNNDSFSIKEIEQIIEKNHNLEVFINVNKMIFNNELDNLKKVLEDLSKLKIKGLLFYDMAVFEIVRELNLNINLVWANTHMVTNYNTCNYYYDKGVKYAVLSGEITLKDMIEIKNKSNIIPMVQLISHPVMSHSKRKLLTNYYQYINEKYDSKTHIITNENTDYLIRENSAGTTIMHSNIMNGTVALKELLTNDFPYIILNDDEIEEEVFKKILELTSKLITNYNEDILKELENLIGSDTVFFFKKTIYKVK